MRGINEERHTEGSILVTVGLWVLFIVSREAIFLFLIGHGTDLGVHRGYVAQILGGRVPYRDFFPEYPPLVFAFTAIPALFNHSLSLYFPIFRGLCCAVDCGIWLMVLRLTCGRPARALLYVLGTTALGALIYDRIDIVLGLILLAAVFFLLSGRDKLAYLMVGIGIAFKFIPIVWVPALLAYAWRKGMCRAGEICPRCVPPVPSPADSPAAKKPPVRAPAALAAGIALLLLAVPTVVSFDAMAALGGHQFGRLFEYHSQRGIQIESGPASVEMLLMRLGTPGDVTFEFGSFNLHTRYENLLVHLSTVLLAAIVLGGGLLALRRGTDAEALVAILAAVLAGTMGVSKVLSPQFFVFLLPVLVVLPPVRRKRANTRFDPTTGEHEVRPDTGEHKVRPYEGEHEVRPHGVPAFSPGGMGWDKRRLGRTQGSTLLIGLTYVLTGLIYPWNYDSLTSLQPLGGIIVAGRNVCLAVLALGLGWRAFQRPATCDVARGQHPS